MTDRGFTRTEGEGKTLDMPEGFQPFTHGQVLGERYQIIEMLGRGGMGEVWQAFDLKLRVEVALKALRPEFFKSERRLELLRQEVRAAREVMSPNVCRIFDLIEIEGRELVSMEYVDGATLLGVLQERGPLDLKEAQDIASQFLAGLEAIHKVGLVHRDIKPENIMLTRAGRVVVMDFGLARQDTEGGGSVSGTPAYMAPEQAAGQHLDARADVYAAGVVLAEMVSPDGIKSYDSRQSVWEGVRSEPAKLPDSPWAPVLKRAVAKDREGRFNTARTLTRALEDVTLRVEGAEDLHPYPGLASFTENDAEYFFGREAEVEQMWRKLEGPPRVLGIMGPSGAGKTSFIRAGLTPNAPSDWAIIRCTPGSAAIPSLRGALTSELAGGSETLQRLVTDPDNPDVIVDAAASWRAGRESALLIIDQFEELFTLNSKEEQRRYATLLGRLPLETDIHVVVSMRDDFAASCNAHEALRAVFHDLTVLDPPTGGNLRRALAQPATRCGYRFEDDDLVEEILGEVEGERGALPLVAFALARLWENRDRDSGLLTRQAYHDIGGVGGALARHAEATIDRIGSDRIAHVRELFRNLVTAEGTRAVREWNELLSVFDSTGVSREGINPSPTKVEAAARSGTDPGREAAEEVLRELIDARLLTSYEVREDEHEPARRVEIIHESLLANWPRLVRWQTQDADAAQLRDQLRQAARTWVDQGRSDDTLWTGSAYHEFASWRERYPGGLSDTEEAFADAMTSLATRRRRRRRIAVTTFIAVLLTGLTVVGSFWRQSVRATHRAEAANLVSMGQLELKDYPTATLAYAIASLGQADTAAGRRLALDALWKGPTAFVVTEEIAWKSKFSPDGRQLVAVEYLQNPKGEKGHFSIFNADGSREYLRNEHGSPPGFNQEITGAGHFLSGGRETDSSMKFVVWSLDDKNPLAATKMEVPPRIPWQRLVDSSRRRAVFTIRDDDRINVEALGFDGTYERLGTLQFKTRRDDSGRWTTVAGLEPRAGDLLGVVSQSEIYVLEVGDHELGAPRYLGRHEQALPNLNLDPRHRFIATADGDGEFRFWDLTDATPPRVFRGPPNSSYFKFSADGLLFEATTEEDGNWLTWVWEVSTNQPRLLRRINFGKPGHFRWEWDTAGRRAVRPCDDLKVRIWSMDALADADPIILSRADPLRILTASFHPQSTWLTTADQTGLTVWPLARDYPQVLRGHGAAVTNLAFDPEGRWLASTGGEGKIRLWPIEGDPPPLAREIGDSNAGLAVSPDGKLILTGGYPMPTAIHSLDGTPTRTLPGFQDTVLSVGFSLDGRLAAAVGGFVDPSDRVIRIWDVASGEEVTVLELGENPLALSLQFISDDHLLSMSESGLVQWNITTGERELLYPGDFLVFSADATGRSVVLIEREDAVDVEGRVLLLDLNSGGVTHLEQFGNDAMSVVINPAGTFAATGDRDGQVRVGSLTGSDAHLFLGHESSVIEVRIDPLGRWIASASDDHTIRLWPMPDLDKPPLHTLPREELITKLKTLTNLRVVQDPDSPTGWKLTHDPFPGWETVPTW